jgi:ferredoxin-like protein FixX
MLCRTPLRRVGAAGAEGRKCRAWKAGTGLTPRKYSQEAENKFTAVAHEIDLVVPEACSIATCPAYTMRSAQVKLAYFDLMGCSTSRVASRPALTSQDSCGLNRMRAPLQPPR